MKPTIERKNMQMKPPIVQGWFHVFLQPCQNGASQLSRSLMIWWPSRFYRLTCQLLETGNLHFWGQIGPLKPSQAFSSFEALLTHCWTHHNTKTRNVNLNTTVQKKKCSPTFLLQCFLGLDLCTKICITLAPGFCCKSLSKHLPTQSAPTIQLLKTWVGLQSRKKQGCKK